jgi:hypothetical protein
MRIEASPPEEEINAARPQNSEQAMEKLVFGCHPHAATVSYHGRRMTPRKTFSAAR